MLLIPIQPVPSQQVLCVLAGQNCQIAIYLRNDEIYVDLASNGVNMCAACLAHNLVALDSRNSYDGFIGNLYFIDTQGVDDPQYTGFNTRWFLIYLSPAEIAAFKIKAIAIKIIPTLTLSAMLSVTAPVDGNFVWPHGLGISPFLIEIIPTSSGAIWGQAGFVDSTNVNLVASEAGVKATVLVYTVAAQNLTVQSPARTLLIDSPAPGDFNVAHGLGATPSLIEILPTSSGAIWGRSPLFDATNIYLTASEEAQTAVISVYAPVTGSFNIQAPSIVLTVTSSAPGEFSFPHGLSTTPTRIEILMISSGSIVAQTPAFDGTNVNLVASDVGCIAKISVYA